MRTDSGYYRYIRRVPADVAHLDRRRWVKQTLKTKDPKLAASKAKIVDASLEAYWTALLAGEDEGDAWARHDAAVKITQSMGFDYLPQEEILVAGRSKVIDRLLALIGQGPRKEIASAVLGTIEKPQPMISGMFDLYMKHKAGDLEGYSSSQLRKHKQPKERAAKYLEEAIGDMPLGDITRHDIIKFRDWWVAKMMKDDLTRDAPNRSFTDIQGMLMAIDGALKTNYRALWGGIRIKEARRAKKKRRPSFANDFIQDKILVPGVLDSINFQARMIFYAQIETGARPSEICNLDPEAIHAWDEIPYIDVTETEDRILKSENATRTIPLVGVSLWALRLCPNGFPKYRNNEDSYSATINKGLKRLGLRPTLRHTAYSMRHSFQDRILAAGATDRVQTDLMGHEFERAKYGEGAAMEQKAELLNRIKFKWPEDAPAGPLKP